MCRGQTGACKTAWNGIIRGAAGQQPSTLQFCRCAPVREQGGLSTLLPVADAPAQVLAAAGTTGATIELALIDALGAVLAEDVIATIAVPGHDNSAMDGYAPGGGGCYQAALPVSQRIAAGSAAAGAELAAGTAARIFTGAVIPPGADAVVMQENCQEHAGVVTISGPVVEGRIFVPGARYSPWGRGACQGRVLRPQDLGLLASVGRAAVVYRPLRVAVLSTGDETGRAGQWAAAKWPAL